MKKLNMLAFDFGASSGRGLVGRFDGSRLEVEEVHRFSNDPVDVAGHTYWDVLRLYWEMQQGLIKFANSKQGDVASIGIDTWEWTSDCWTNPANYWAILTTIVTSALKA